MQIQIFFLLLLIAFNGLDAGRITNKANLRGLITQYSSLSPREVMLLRNLINTKQKRKRGRFH